MRGYEREAIRTGSGGVVVATVVGCVVVIGVLLIGAMWVFGFGLFSATTAETRGQTDQREQTQADGTYRIARYDLFHDRCEAIVAVEGEIDATKQALGSEADETQRFYDQQNLRAQQANRRQLVAQYNADAAKEATAGQFRDSDLPSRIDPNGSETSCTAG